MDSTMTIKQRASNSPRPQRVIDGIVEKQCRQCEAWKPFETDFYPGNGICKSCHRTQSDEWREQNPESRKESARAGQRKRRHGVTREEYGARCEAVGGCCQICGVDPIAAELAKPWLVIDHDHATGEFRGMLCFKCNIAIGHLQDDVDRLKAAITYLGGGISLTA